MVERAPRYPPPLTAWARAAQAAEFPAATKPAFGACLEGPGHPRGQARGPEGERAVPSPPRPWAALGALLALPGRVSPLMTKDINVYIFNPQRFLPCRKPAGGSRSSGRVARGAVGGFREAPGSRIRAGLQRAAPGGIPEPPQPESSHGSGSAEPQHASFDPGRVLPWVPRAQDRTTDAGVGSTHLGERPLPDARRRPQPVVGEGLRPSHLGGCESPPCG